MSDQDRRTGRGWDDPPGLFLAAFDYDRRYVLGFPVHVAMTLCADYPGSVLMSLPLATWAGNGGTIGIRLIDPATGRVLVKTEPSPVALPELGTSTFSLPPGGCRRMLTDVSSHLPGNLDPGYYDLRVIYAALLERVESPVVLIELVAPNAQQRKTLNRLKPELTRLGTWGRWTSLPPPGGAAAIVPPTDPLDPLRFNRILRYLMYGPTELWDVDPALLDILHGIYEPESHALVAELCAARGDAQGFAEQAEIIRTSFAGLMWWIKDIEAGRSHIPFARRCREQP